MKKIYSTTIFCLIAVAVVKAQNVSINSNGASAHASAMLDVSSSSKGVLIPRVALTGSRDQTTVPTPAVSLLIYNTATVPNGFSVFPGYYYWGGSSWIQLATLTPSTTPWLITGNAGTNPLTNFIGTTDNVPLNIRVNNQKAGGIDSALENTFWGYQSGSNTTGQYNTGLGYKALNANITGWHNTAIGFGALSSGAEGNNNTAVGSGALFSITTGMNNVAIGADALITNSEGSDNTALGNDALYLNSTGTNNTGMGHYTLHFNSSGTFNTASGNGALAKNMTGSYNTATGTNALSENTTASSNTGNGYGALYSNQTGYSNVAIGVNALYKNISSANLVAIGDSALYNNTAVQNTSVGSKSLVSNTTGIRNTATGFNALHSNIQGFSNTAVGVDALTSNNTGIYNTGIGVQALYTNTDGTRNTAIGFGADVSSSSLTNATAIGSTATVNASNKVRIGNTAVTVIEGQVPYSFPSDARFKYNIKDNVPGLDFIKKLTPVTYYFDSEKLSDFAKTGVINNSIVKPASYNNETQLHTGFLAQDVEKIAGELGYQFDGLHVPANDKDHYSLAYSQFIMPLVKSVQEQQQIIEAQDKKINSQQEQIKRMNEQLNALIKEVEILKGK